MRIAYLSSDFGVPIEGTGGKSVHLREIVSALAAQGHSVRVFSPNAPPDGTGNGAVEFAQVPLDGFAAEGLRLAGLEDRNLPDHLIREWRRLLYSEHSQRTLLPLLQEFRPDLLLERYSLFAYAGVELAESLGVPHILEVNAPLRIEQARYRQLVLEGVAEELERQVFNAADALIVVSNELAAHARTLGVPARRITVIPNGVDPGRFHPDVSGASVRNQYGLEGNSVIGFVGSLKRWHDLDTLVDAFRVLATTDDRLHLLVAGDGPRMAELWQLGNLPVTCTGAVDPNRVPEVMAAMDVVVVPYADRDSYFSPLKLFEAMAMGKPVVGARVGQVNEVLDSGLHGVTYEPADVHDLAAKIRAVLDLPDGGREMGAAARRWVVANRTWDQSARDINDVAESLVAVSEAR